MMCICLISNSVTQTCTDDGGGGGGVFRPKNAFLGTFCTLYNWFVFILSLCATVN